MQQVTQTQTRTNETTLSFYEVFCEIFILQHLVMYVFLCAPVLGVLGFVLAFLFIFPIMDITIAFTQTSCTNIPNLFVNLTFKQGFLLFISSEYLIIGTALFAYIYYKHINTSEDPKNSSLIIYIMSIEAILCFSIFLSEIVMITSNTHTVKQCDDLWVQDYLTNELIICARFLSFTFGMATVIICGTGIIANIRIKNNKEQPAFSNYLVV